MLATAALVCTVAYLGWRSTTLGSGLALLLSVPLFAAEIWAFAQLSSLAYQGWRLPTPEGRDHTSAISGDTVDVLISAARADAAEIERSLVGSASLAGRGRLLVIDGQDRNDIRTIAQRAGADYIADPEISTSTAAVIHAHATSELYLWLEAGQVPMPNLLTSSVARFDDPYVAVCQHAVGLLNADSLVHLRGGRDEAALLRNVIGPGLDRRGTAPWLGPAALVRRRAVNVAGGFMHDDPAAVEQLLVNLHRRGYKSAFEQRKLVRATAPDSLEDYLSGRHRRGVEALRIFRTAESPLRARGLSMSQRLTHLTIGFGFARGVRQLVLLAVLIGTLLSGRMPSDAPVRTLVGFWLVTTALSIAAHRALGRGSMAVGDWVRHGWRTAGADMSALCTVLGLSRGPHGKDRGDSRGGFRSLGRLRLLTTAVVALDLVLLARAATIIKPDLLPAFTTGQRVVVLAAGLVVLLPMLDVLQVIVFRQQRRSHFRLQTALPIELNDSPGTTVDLAPIGVGVLMSFAPAIGAHSTFRLQLPRIDGTVQTVRGTATVRAANLDDGGKVRVGLEFLNLSDEARVALIEYCAIGHAHLATDQVTPPLVAPGQLAVERRDDHHRSLQVLTGLAITAGAATLLVGPAAGAAFAEESKTELVCVVSPAGDPVAGAAVEQASGGSWNRLGETTASGCLTVTDAPVGTVFAATHEGLRSESNEGLVAGSQLTFILDRHTVRLLDTSGTAVAGATLRYFTDSWRSAVDAGPGEAHFDTLTSEVSVEVALDGRRLVVELEPGVTNLVLARLFADETANILEVDLGNGWVPFVDGMQVLPGRVVLRLADGDVIKVSVPGAHDLRVPSGELTQLSVPLPPAPTPMVPATPPPSSAPATTPGPDATPERTPGSDPTAPPTAEDSPVEAPAPALEPLPTSTVTTAPTEPVPTETATAAPETTVADEGVG